VPQNGHWNVPSSAEVAPSSGNRTFDWAAWRSLESKTLTTRLHDTHGINRVNNTDAMVPPAGSSLADSESEFPERV
jgi:hypothetical protein